MATQKDVARRAGVSRASVSNFINNKGYVSADARARIGTAIRELNYHPNIVARSLKTKLTKTIGVIFPDVDSSFTSGIIHNIEEVAHSLGYRIILCITNNDTDKERETIRSLKERFVDGFIINPTPELNSCQYEELAESHVVYVHRCTPPVNDNEAIVKLDNYLGVKLGLEYLLELGHRDIGIIKGPGTFVTGPERYDHLIDLMKKYEIPVHEKFIVEAPDYTEYNGYAKTKHLLHRGTLPTAIFSLCGGLSIGALKAFREAGLNIPGDISFISFDNTNYTEYLDPPLTTILQPVAEFGITAMQTLSTFLTGGKLNNNVIELKPEIIIRNSCMKPLTVSPPVSSFYQNNLLDGGTYMDQ